MISGVSSPIAFSVALSLLSKVRLIASKLFRANVVIAECVRAKQMEATGNGEGPSDQTMISQAGVDNTAKLDSWLDDAHRSGLYGLRRFAHTIRHDLAAVRNAISERWSNGQTEGHINRLKTLKRQMYGRAGTELLRARLLPLSCNLPTN